MVVNASHNINFNCENFWIIGEVGRGKTTFFDKLYHFFCFREKIKSPIQGLKTDLSIELKNSDVLKIHFTRLKKKITITMLDESDEIEILDILRSKGLTDNDFLKLIFISQNEEDDHIYDSQLNLTNFFELNKRFFLDKRDYYILNRFSEIIKEQTTFFEKIISQKNQVNITILNLKRDIEKNEILQKSLQNFIDNYEDIKKFISFVKVDKNLRNLNSEKNEIQEKIFEQETKIKNLNQIKKFDNAYFSQKDKVKPLIKSLYIDYEPLCPICSNYIDLNTFRIRFNSDICYLCGASAYDYIEKEESIVEKKKNEKVEVTDIKSLEYQLNNKKNELIKEKEKIEEEINNYKQYTQPIDDHIKKIINENYLDLTRPGFSINEEYNRKLELKAHYSELIKNQKDLLEEHNQKFEFIKETESSLKNIIEILQRNYQNLKEKIEQKIQDLFKMFIRDLRLIWGKLTNEPIKTIIYDRKEDLLKIMAVSTTGNRFLYPITSLKLNKEEQRHFSNSQSNALRYALHLSLIRILFERFKNFPLKSIIIDEPPPYRIKERLFKIIKEDFIESFDFQFIIISTIKEEPFLDWNEEEFLPYDRYFSVKSQQVQKLINDSW